MSGGLLELEIVTPDGIALQARGVETVVIHRRERSFDVGSEIAIYPRHAAMLVRIPVAAARYDREGATVHLALGGGFVEVREDHVVVVTPRFACVPADETDAAAAAWRICARWRTEAAGTREELVGLRPGR
ncbi:MAG TPA: hypothetical protein VMT93_02270 [Gemmatimonadaceae bacterium]|nr:hypothetical protein [Gemmatimonadaceae bacterium]